MKVIYQDREVLIDFPKDTKYFKLTRKYYPDFKIEIYGEAILVELKELKTLDEIRSRKFNKHHIKAKSNGGVSIERNLLKLDISRHNAYHLLFGNLNLYEVIELLKRVIKIKEGR